MKRIMSKSKAHTIKNIDLAKKVITIIVLATRVTSSIVLVVKMILSSRKVKRVNIKALIYREKVQV